MPSRPGPPQPRPSRLPGTQALGLQAFDGWDIPNSIDPDPSPAAVTLARQSRRYRLLIASSTELGQPSGRYNCHGLVFGSRRVNIDSPTLPVDIDSLFQRDRYLPVDSPQVGDVIAYRGARAIEHTGIVSRLEALSSAAGHPVVVVWSMWGGLGEFEHREAVCPYADCRIEYWRLQRE